MSSAGSVASHTAKFGVQVQSATTRARIMAGTVLLEDSDYRLFAAVGTNVTVRYDRPARRLICNFSPYLKFRINHWLASDVRMTAIVLDLAQTSNASGNVIRIDVSNEDYLVPMAATVRGRIEQKIQPLLKQTRLGDAGYRPLEDPDPAGLVREIAAAFGAGATSTGACGPITENLTGLQGTITIKSTKQIEEGAADGSVQIPSGTALTVAANLQGTAADVLCRTVRVDSVRITSNGIYLVQDGKRQAKITSLLLKRGGAVEAPLSGFEAVPGGKLDTGEGVGALFGFLASIFRSGGVTAEGDMTRGVETVKQHAKKQIEEALSRALVQLWNQHYDTLAKSLPSVNWSELLGIPAPN